MNPNPDNQQPKGGTNFPNHLDVPPQSSQQPNKELDEIKLSISFTERQLDDMKPGDEIEIGLTDEAKQRLNKLLKEAYERGKEDGLQSK